MDGVTVIEHPLVRHKLTIMRKKETSTAGFRRLLREISTLLCYEVTRDLEMTMETIDTPLETIEAPVLEGKKLVFASILRAGNGLLEGMSSSCLRRVFPISVFIAIMTRWKPSNITSRLQKASMRALSSLSIRCWQPAIPLSPPLRS